MGGGGGDRGGLCVILTDDVVPGSNYGSVSLSCEPSPWEEPTISVNSPSHLGHVKPP